MEVSSLTEDQLLDYMIRTLAKPGDLTDVDLSDLRQVHNELKEREYATRQRKSGRVNWSTNSSTSQETPGSRNRHSSDAA